jgi:ribosome-binding factor A
MFQGKQKSFHRSDKVRKQIIREMGDILLRCIKVPEFQNLLVSVTEVDVTHDLSFARIFYSVMGSDEDKALAQAIITDYKPQIRYELGQRIKLRHTPDIELTLDDSLERGTRVTQLLDQISKGEL